MRKLALIVAGLIAVASIVKCRVEGYFQCSSEPAQSAIYSQNGEEILADAWQRLYAQGACPNPRAFEALNDVADMNHDGEISAYEASLAARVVFNRETPVGRLWFPYREADVSLETRASFDQMLQNYAQWSRVIQALVDESGDGRYSKEEIRRAMLKQY